MSDRVIADFVPRLTLEDEMLKFRTPEGEERKVHTEAQRGKLARLAPIIGNLTVDGLGLRDVSGLKINIPTDVGKTVIGIFAKPPESERIARAPLSLAGGYLRVTNDEIVFGNAQLSEASADGLIAHLEAGLGPEATADTATSEPADQSIDT